MEGLRLNYNRIISPKLAKKLLFVLIFVIIFDFSMFPFPTLAGSEIKEEIASGTLIESVAEENITNAYLPENIDLKAKYTVNTTITAYNSDIYQCDDSPCITANGFDVCKHGIEDTIAANFLKFGTKVKIPDHFGDRVFIVRDRMNRRYTNRIDIWMLEKQDAKKFGIKRARIEILEQQIDN
jgi:3D (Asp-Asp-Asp) domain-containing protein